MKKKFTLLLFLAVFVLSINCQTTESIQKISDSISLKTIYANTYGDTTWVLDSNYQMGLDINSGEFYIRRKYKVLTRNWKGNITTAVNNLTENSPISLNKECDSIVYFDGENIQKYFTKAWNSVTENWVDEKYFEYEYPNIPKEVIYMNFSDFMQTFYGNRLQYFNNDGHPDSQIYYNYNNYLGTWTQDQKYTMLYNSNNKVYEEFHFKYDTTFNTWDTLGKVLFYYNSNGNIDSSKILGKSQYTGEWHEPYKSNYTYDNQNRLLIRIQKQYNQNSQDYLNLWKDEYNYDNNNKVLIKKEWKMPDEQWINYKKTMESYIYEDIVDTIKTERWSEYLEYWEKENMVTYDYDHRMNLIQESKYYKNFEYNIWQMEEKIVYFWSPFFSNGIDEMANIQKINVYPNPASDFINFSIEENTNGELTIYNISGRKIESINMHGGKARLECKTMKTGIYFYRFSGTESVFSGRFIVE